MVEINAPIIQMIGDMTEITENYDMPIYSIKIEGNSLTFVFEDEIEGV